MRNINEQCIQHPLRHRRRSVQPQRRQIRRIHREQPQPPADATQGLYPRRLIAPASLSYTKLGKLGKAQFDCAFSNFGGLNCVADLKLVADEVRPLLNPNAKIIWALMPPFCLWESAMLLRGRFRLATRRFAGKSTVFKEGLNYPVYYYTPKQVAQAWGNSVQIESIRALSVITPPATNKDFAIQRPRLFDLLGKLDDLVESKFPFKYWGDFTMVTLGQK